MANRRDKLRRALAADVLREGRPRRRYGDQRACSRCGTDVEWHGREHGWLDRGSGTRCGPYQPVHGGDFVYPKGKHTVPADKE